MSEMLKEFSGRGLINRFFLKYAGWLYSAVVIVAVTWVWNHESALVTYVEAHDVSHVELNGKLDTKLDAIVEQINTNFKVNDVYRKIDRESAKSITTLPSPRYRLA